MTAVAFGPVPKLQFNQNGIPLAGGRLFTYAAGTSNKLATYTDSSGGTANTNPIILDANGQCDLFLNSADLYKLVLSPSTDTDPPTDPFWTEDNVAPMASAVTLNNFITLIEGATGAAQIGYTQPGTGGTTTYVSSQLAQLSYTGQITMLQNAAGTWLVFNQFGNLVNTSSSTTDGLQEAINLGFTANGTRGYNVVVNGGDVSTGGASVIFCTTTVNVPASQGKCLYIYACTVNFNNSSGDGFLIDSLEMTHIEMPGSQVVYAGPDWAVNFTPSTGTPGDDIVIAGDSRVYITSISVNSSSAAGAVKFNPVNAPMATATYIFDEINGLGNDCIGVGILTTTKSFNNNSITIGHLHDLTGVPLLVGNSDSDASNTVANKFFINTISPSTTSNPCIDVYGQQNYFNVAINAGEGTPAYGIKLEGSAQKNIFDILRNDATNACQDLSSSKDNIGMYGIGASCCSINLGGTDQTGVLNNTITKIAFSSSVINDDGCFDSTNHRWIPGKPGRARISATVVFDAAVDGTEIGIFIYVNGSASGGANSVSYAKGTGPQGASISFTLPVNSATDYFEIWALQNSGSTQSISGLGGSTFANFEMISQR